MQSNRETERALELVLGSIAVLEGLKARQGVPVGDVIANLGTVAGVLADLDDQEAEAEYCSWCDGPCKVGGPILAPIPDVEPDPRPYDTDTTLPSGVSERTVGWIRPDA